MCEGRANGDGATASREAELRVGVIRPVALLLEDRFGSATLEAATRVSGVQRRDLQHAERWVSIDQAEAFLAFAFDILERDERVFRDAFRYRYSEAYGSLKFLLWATTPRWVILNAARTLPLVSPHARYELVGQGRRELRWRYHSVKREGRLLCLARQGNVIAMPTLWGLPPGVLTEHGCAALGDPYCEYHVQWAETSRIGPLLLGGAAGGAVVLAAYLVGAPWLHMLLLPLVTSVAAHAFELRRAHRANLAIAEESRQAMEHVIRREREARAELAALQQAQEEWLHSVEASLEERTEVLRRIVERLTTLQASRDSSIRSLSHDLRNPLQVVRITSEMLRADASCAPEVDENLGVQAAAIERMEQILAELHDQASRALHARPEPQMEPVEVHRILDELMPRIRALVLGRPIELTSSVDPAVPSTILVDRLVFDRVLDNLITNAAKHTRNGRIHVELSVSEGFLCIGVIDTGCGIDETRLLDVFASLPRREGDAGGWGVGLSQAALLLGSAGGMMKASSMKGRGSAFWALFPVCHNGRDTRASGPPEPLQVTEILPWHDGLNLRDDQLMAPHV